MSVFLELTKNKNKFHKLRQKAYDLKLTRSRIYDYILLKKHK